MTPVEVLERAHALIEDPRHWCQHAGQIGDSKRCATAAIWTVAGHSEVACAARLALTEYLPFSNGPFSWGTVVWYNDHHKHFQVMRLFRLTIASAKAGGKAARAQARRIRQQVIAMRKSAETAAREPAHV